MLGNEEDKRLDIEMLMQLKLLYIQCANFRIPLYKSPSVFVRARQSAINNDNVQ